MAAPAPFDPSSEAAESGGFPALIVRRHIRRPGGVATVIIVPVVLGYELYWSVQRRREIAAVDRVGRAPRAAGPVEGPACRRRVRDLSAS